MTANNWSLVQNSVRIATAHKQVRTMNRAFKLVGPAGWCAMFIDPRVCIAVPIADGSQSSTSSSPLPASQGYVERKPARMDKDYPLKIGTQ